MPQTMVQTLTGYLARAESAGQKFADAKEFLFPFVSEWTFAKDGRAILFATTGNDSTSYGKEFKVRRTGAVLPDSAWVGDDTFFPDGIGYSIVPEPGMTLDAITGIVRYRRTNTTPPRLGWPWAVTSLERPPHQKVSFLST
jgi:hypothetical protein